MSDDGDTSPLYFSRRIAFEQGTLALGEQTCKACGRRQMCAWPPDADDLRFECGSCGEMAAEFTIAHRLDLFPDWDVTVRSRQVWLEFEPHAPFKES